MPQPFLLLIVANLAHAAFLVWKCSLWPVPAWLLVQWRKAVFFLTLYDSINDMKPFRNVCITPQMCHSHFCCWLLAIWPSMDVWAGNGAYGQCQLGFHYNRENMYFLTLYFSINGIKYFQNCMHHTSAVPQPFLLMIAANLAQAGCLGWKWS